MVIRDADGGSVGLVVGAPVVLVDGRLAARSRSVGGTAGGRDGAFGAGEVERLGQDDNASRRVREVGDEFGIGARVDCSGAATASDSLCETLSGARDGDGSSTLRHGGHSGEEERRVSHVDESEVLGEEQKQGNK